MDVLGTTTAANRGSRNEIQQSHYTHGDALDQFKTAIEDAGLIAPERIITGKITAFPGLNKPKFNKAARCFLFPDRRGGWFMDYSTGLFEVWQAKRDKPYTVKERQTFREQCERDRLAREQEKIKIQQATAKKAVKIWRRAIYADSSNHYLYRKKVQSHGTKTGDSGGLKGVLIVPIYDESLKLVNLQFIQPDGTKRFLTGGQKKNCFWWIGKKSPTILISESLSTAASLHEHTGYQTFISFGEGNLVNVAKIVRAKNPNAKIIVMGDNDESGVGQQAARLAALAVGGKCILPPTLGQDWNDHLTGGRS